MRSAMMAPAVTFHIRPTAALAERALLPEDPGRALALAQVLLERPLMFNHNRGLWGYTGSAPDGQPLTIQSTGIGGPSAVIVLEELISLGLRRAVRVGTCRALAPGLELGAALIVESAMSADGTSQTLGAGERTQGDPTLTAALRRVAPRAPHGIVASTDLLYTPHGAGRWAGSDGGAAWRSAGAMAVELESAALFTLAARRRVAVASVLVVADLAHSRAPRWIEDQELVAAAERAGRCAALALSG